MKKNVLTPSQVKKLGLDNVSVITADMLEGYTRIGEYAFEYCGVLTSVTIPDSVTSIGGKAFSGCNNLTSIKIPNTVTSIGDCAFYNCYALTSLNIPNSVIDIGYGAFYSCKSLTSVVIPDGVTCIENYVFRSCISLTSVTIGNSVTCIGISAFRDCCSLTSVTIGNNVVYIDSQAFENCYNLSSVKICGNITYIGPNVFSDCNFKRRTVTCCQDKVITAYKGFGADMTCRDFKYKEGETYEIEDEAILCRRGFHACLNPLDCFSYYFGQIGKDVVFHEVYLEGLSNMSNYDSKIAAKKITIGREISLTEMADIASGRK